MATLHELARANARDRVEHLQQRAVSLAYQLRCLADEIRDNHADLNRALATVAALDASGADEPPAGAMG